MIILILDITVVFIKSYPIKIIVIIPDWGSRNRQITKCGNTIEGQKPGTRFGLNETDKTDVH